MRSVCAVLISLAFLSIGQAIAIPGDPTINSEEQGKARVVTQYLVIFQKALLGSLKEALSSDTPPYDLHALDKATSEHDRQVALCDARKPELGTEVAYAACLIAARRDFAAAISLKEMGLVEAIASSFHQVALDTDSGRLTGAQAHDIYGKLDAVYALLFDQLSRFYDFQTEARLGSEYKDRFIKSYREGGSTASIPAGQPPLDDETEGPAAKTLTAEQEVCEKTAKPLPDKRKYADCILAAERKFADSVKLKDLAWFHAFEKALRAAQADVEAKRLTPGQFDAVAAWINDAYSERINQQQTEYHALAAAPIAEGYAVRFGAAYVAVSGDRFNDKIMPLDNSAMDQAVRDQREANSKCRAQYNPASSEVVNLECYFATCRTFAQAIKLRDMRLLELYITAMRAAASDSDNGRLTKWQRDAVYSGITRYFYGIYMGSSDAYLAKHYRVVARPYLNSFDNDYVTSRRTVVEDDNIPPWDMDAVPIAQKTYDQSMNACYLQRAELKTSSAFWDCRAAAERELASSIHRRDMLVLDKFLAADKQAAVDADAGRISAEQLEGIDAALRNAYQRINESAWRAWHSKQQIRGTAP